MVILVFGIQGSGKSTHAHYIAHKLNIPYISTGDILRTVQEEKTEIGKKIKSLMAAGNIIPDEYTLPALKSFMKKEGIHNSFVMEGFPRTMDQVTFFTIKVDVVFEFVVPEKIAIERLQKRGRYDDIKESIQRRLELFNEKTLPVINFYKKQGSKVYIVSNEKSIQEVQKEIDGLLKN